MTRRVIDIIQHLEEDKTVDTIPSKETYYNDLLDNESYLFDIGLIGRAPAYTSMQRQFSKEKYEEAIKFIQP